ncbi:MAG TPA: sulfotransferase family 2 domain-containing protein [Pyrinomonadaceae bacterium]|jgi:hypothetical protein
MENKRVLIYLHIPKTGGLTLRSIIERNFPSDSIHHIDGSPGSKERFIELPEATRRRINVLRGHMPFGLHAHLYGRADYLTMLRHPVERIISLYYYILATPNNNFHAEVAGRRMSLADFVESRISQAKNHQTRMISGLENRFDDAALEVAKANLRTHFTAVGLNEKFDESLILFKRLLGWNNIFYVKRNVTKKRPRLRDVPDATVKLIEKQNALDTELYEFAAQRFRELVAQQDDSFHDELLAFRRSNKLYGGFRRGYEAASRALPASVKTAIKKIGA